MPESPSVASVAFVAPLLADALHGLPGDIVRTIEPHSEADPLAILIQFLVAFGNAVGRSPYFQVEATRHHMNLNALLVGDTSKSRKGTAWSQVLRLFPMSGLHDPLWAETRIVRGLSTGEGLIWHVRDPNLEMKDPGVSDKRLLVVEGEFAFPLQTMRRDGNTLSPVIRDAWDGVSPLATLTKNSPARSTNAHISIIGHITQAELLEKFNRTELANGFANRFLFVWVRRSKLLPTGGQLTEEALHSLVQRVYDARKFARTVGRMQFDAETEALWYEVYATLSEGKPGLIGAVTARAEAQVIRLACLYALLDGSATVRVEHLRAALAVWSYSEASAGFLFSSLTGDPTADRLRAELRARGVNGMTETEIRDLFHHHDSQRIDRALNMLQRCGLVRTTQEPTAGRPATRWVATEATKATKGPDGGRQGGDA